MNIFRLCKIFQGSKSRNENMNTEGQRRVRGAQNYSLRAVSVPERECRDLYHLDYKQSSEYDPAVSKQLNSYVSLPNRDLDLLNRNNFSKREFGLQNTSHQNLNFSVENSNSNFYNSGFGIPYKVNDKKNNINMDYLRNHYIKKNRMMAMRNTLQQNRRNEKMSRLPVCKGMAGTRTYIHNSRPTTQPEEPIWDEYMRSNCASCPFPYEKRFNYHYTPEKYEIPDLNSKFIKSISDHITFLLIENFLSTDCCYKPFYSCLRNILPIYLISGYVYLRRYLNHRLKDFKQLLKIFISCCWIAIKATNDNHISCKDLLDDYSIDPEEISFIEAHILSKINYDIEISKKDILEVIE